MKPLYLNSAVHDVLPDALRPGELVLTQKFTELVDVTGKIVVDVGCGRGTSLKLLKSCKPKFAVGLDIERKLLQQAAQNNSTIQADMAKIPLGKVSVDVVLAECAWNMSNQQAALTEFHRILRPGGTLALSDIFYRRNAAGRWPVPCCFSAAKTEKEIKQMVSTAGFTLLHFTDHSRLLKESAARFIFQFGSLQKFWQAVCGNSKEAEAACALGKAALPGLFFLLARRNE